MTDLRSMRTAEQMLITEDGRAVAYVSKHLTEGEQEHYAALIVEAVNSHAAAERLAGLVAAMRDHEQEPHADDTGINCPGCLPDPALYAALDAYRASKEASGGA